MRARYFSKKSEKYSAVRLILSLLPIYRNTGRQRRNLNTALRAVHIRISDFIL